MMHRISELDLCRLQSLMLGERTVAILVIFIEAGIIEAGIACTWKIAYATLRGGIDARR